MARWSGKGLTAGLVGFELVTGHVCCVILVVLNVVVGLIGMGITKVVMGAVYFNACAKEEMVPIYLVVSGACTILLLCLSQFRPRADEKRWRFLDKLNVVGVVGLIGVAFYFIWLFYGCALIIGNLSDVIDGCPGQTDCCDKDLIKFSMFTVVVDLIVCAALIVGLVLLILLVVLAREPEHSKLDANES